MGEGAADGGVPGIVFALLGHVFLQLRYVCRCRAAWVPNTLRTGLRPTLQAQWASHVRAVRVREPSVNMADHTTDNQQTGYGGGNDHETNVPPAARCPNALWPRTFLAAGGTLAS